MNCMTLREICETLGVSRRALQGYEKAGLVAATGRNKYGHLLYDDSAKLRIARIKFYQQLGFTIKEITAIIDSGLVINIIPNKINNNDTIMSVHPDFFKNFSNILLPSLL